MADLAGLIEASHAQWLPRVVEAVLGTNEPTAIADALTSAVEAALGATVVDAVFYEPGVGIVVGFELADGRQVVAKVHRGEWVTRRRLEAVAQVQATVADAGLPAPRPLAGPIALGAGWLMAEELREGVDRVDGFAPAIRAELATQLHRFVEAARPHAEVGWVGTWMGERDIDDLWPHPHDLRFDFPATVAGAEWIDDVARAARDLLEATDLLTVVGHFDWRVQNVGFDAAGRLTAIYDWDSLGLAPEPAAVGSASVVHPIDWRDHGPDPLPSIEHVEAFVTDYEAARGTPFTGEERAVLEAGQRWVVCFGARCQHSDDVLDIFPGVDHSLGWPRLLRDLLAR